MADYNKPLTGPQSAQFSGGSSTPPEISAASVRAPMRGEIRVLAVTTSSKTWNVPQIGDVANPVWAGRYIDMQADGGDVWIQFSTGTDAAVDETAVAQEAVASGRTTMSASASGNECFRIPKDETRSIPVPSSALTFAIKGSIACKLRTHPSET